MQRAVAISNRNKREPMKKPGCVLKYDCRTYLRTKRRKLPKTDMLYPVIGFLLLMLSASISISMMVVLWTWLIG